MKQFILLFFLFTCVISYSQSKISWNNTLNLASNNYSNNHPRISLDGSGNPLVIWGRSSDESVFFSKWNGTTFTTPVKLNPSWLTVATASWMGPDIASKGDTIYVVMKRTPENLDSNHIYLVSSFDAGKTFSTPVRVDYIKDSLSRFPIVAVDDSGNPIVGFMKFNAAFADSRWAVTKSSDYGKSFTIDNKASGWSSQISTVCDCCPGSLISAGNITAMLYRDNNSNIRDIWTGISNNNNESFNTGFSLDNGKWAINSCPASGPDGVILGDSIYSVYMSGSVGSYRTYLSRASISNQSLGKVKGLTGSIAGLSLQNYPRIASDGKAGAIVWVQTVNGNTQLPILFTNKIVNGFPSKFDTVDLSNITAADVALSNGNIYVVWEDDNSGTIKIRSGNYNPIVTKTETNVNLSIQLYPNPVTDVLNVVTPNDSNYSIQIYNSNGQLIQSIESESKLQVDTSKYKNGIYYVQINTNKHFSTLKFIKE